MHVCAAEQSPSLPRRCRYNTPPPPTPPKHPSPCPSIPKVVLMQIRETKRCPAVEAGKLMGWFGF